MYNSYIKIHGDVFRKLNQAFPLVDSLNFNFDDEDIYASVSLEADIKTIDKEDIVG